MFTFEICDDLCLLNMTRIMFLLRCNPFTRSLVSLNKLCGNGISVNYRNFSTTKFEEIAAETLESLHEYFEDLLENCIHLPDSDIMLSSGVLTVDFGQKKGTYVINKQTPNSQLWLSSPVSGPKRYNYNADVDAWIYRHDDHSLHQLLQLEIPNFVQKNTNFFKCKHSGSDRSF